jgi:hypothetical protein
MDWITRTLSDLLRYAEGMGRQEWLLVLAGVILIGLACLKGFGSRAKY